jgi:uncharacterized protein
MHFVASPCRPKGRAKDGLGIAPAAVVNRTIRDIGIAAVGTAAAAAVYALYIEPRWLQCTRTRMSFASLPPELEGLRIALLTDLHTGRASPDGLIARAVEMTMRERPDMIAISGDIAESEPMLEQTLDDLAKSSAPLGVYIVPGNHDYRDVGIERWHDAVARRPGLVDLTNSARLLEVPASSNAPGVPVRQSPDEMTAVEAASGAAHIRLCVAGVDDFAEGRPRLDALHDIAFRDFTILLAHNPDQAEQARRGIDRVDLVLSGHTHGGQVRLPGWGAIVNSAEHADLYEAGVRRRPWTQVYTSRGIGTVHLPVRFLTRPEVAILTLTSSARERSAGWGRWARPGGRSRFAGMVAR